MDPILDPAKVQAFAAYADHHELFDLFEGMVKSVVVDMPPDPLQHMIDYLKAPQLPAIVVCGPPRSRVHRVAEQLAIPLNAVFISVNSLLVSAIERQTSLGQQARPYMEKGQLVPDQIILNLVLQRLQEPDINSLGFVMEGFPATKEQAIALQTKGIFLSCFVWIECDDEAILQYNSEILTDPVTKRDYHLTYNPPPDHHHDITSRLVQREQNKRDTVARRLAQYRRHAPAVAACFARAGVCRKFKYVDAHGVWGRETDVVAEVLASSALGMRGPTRAPRQFRVVVQGLPGSGRSSVAAEIERKYGFVHVSPKKIVLEEVSAKSKISKTLVDFIHNPDEIPDDLIQELIVKRLQQSDCINQGWVLEGYPNSQEQAKTLKEKGILPNRLIWLKVTEETCQARLALRRQDPLTGHLVNLHASESTYPSRATYTIASSWPRRDPIADADETVLNRIKRQAGLRRELETFYGFRRKAMVSAPATTPGGSTKPAAAGACGAGPEATGIMQEVDAEGIGERDAKGRHVGLERVLELVDDVLMKPVPVVISPPVST
ncbi:hypothetical protein BC830DRAFT_1113146 [Chytriomyces sp. MP71]|nr:hypothetical protein BC830DRAFT_1113146 [Chytriomyces sp. MP71]